jgi:hypothetical protein
VNITTIRGMYPQYEGLTDKQLVDVIHDKYYSNIPIKKFYAKVGLIKPHPPQNKKTQHTEKSNLSNQIAINPKNNPIVEPRPNISTDESIFLWVVVGLIIFFIFKKLLSVFKKPIPKRFAKQKRFDEKKVEDMEVDITDIERFKNDTNKLVKKLTTKRLEFKQTCNSLAEHTKVDANKLNLLEVELNNTKAELAEGIKLEAEPCVEGLKENIISLSLGFSRPVDFAVPSGITIETPSEREVIVRGNDKQLVDEVSAKIRATLKRLSALDVELNHTKAELAERIRLENENTVDAKRVATIEKEINLAKIELEKRIQIEEERIKVIPTKHVKLEREFNKVRSFEKETRLEAEQIKVDEDKLSVLKNEFNQAHAGLEEQLRLETDPFKLYENTSITKYKLGDIGPNGGKIFYINDIGNIGTEVKTADENQRMNWFESVSKLRNNWRLPNKNELELLYKQKDTIGNFSMYAYWSSTEYNDLEAWVQFFNAGAKYPQRKNLQCNVRAVGSFHYSANNESPKYENLKYINPNPEKNSVMPIISTEKLADNLTRSSVSLIKDENTDKFEGMF